MITRRPTKVVTKLIKIYYTKDFTGSDRKIVPSHKIIVLKLIFPKKMANVFNEMSPFWRENAFSATILFGR
jgi:hypothetical protein